VEHAGKEEEDWNAHDVEAVMDNQPINTVS